jgi:hypothetical protein
MNQRSCVLMLGAFLAALALAQWAPKGPVRLVVPFAAGGPTDLQSPDEFARFLKKEIDLRRAVVVKANIKLEM